MNVVLSKIKESAVITESHTDYSEASTPLVADSIISLSQLFANVNSSDKRFLKYVPDNFLSAEQIEAKREAQKIDYNKYGRYAEVFKMTKTVATTNSPSLMFWGQRGFGKTSVKVEQD